MYGLDVATSVAAEPARPAQGANQFWTNGDPGLGVPATIPPAYWFNMVQKEILKVITDAGLTPSKADDTQLSAAISALIAAGGGGGGGSAKFISPHLIPVYNSSTQITLPSGLTAESSTGSHTITLPGTVNLDITVSGDGGLDTGVEASDTLYAVYLIKDSTDVLPDSAVFSANFTAPTLPAGYDKFRRLNMWVYNNSAGDIQPFRLFNWPYNTLVWYDARTTYLNGSVFVDGDLNVLSKGAATVMTTVGCGTFIPSICRQALLSVNTDHAGTGTAYFYIRPKSGTSNGISVVGSGAVMDHNLMVPTDSTQNIEYQKYTDTGGGGVQMTLDVSGGYVTEVS